MDAKLAGAHREKERAGCNRARILRVAAVMGGDEGLNLREGGTGSGDVVEDLLEMRAGERGICVCNLGESTVGVRCTRPDTRFAGGLLTPGSRSR
jgi:hypothetical protein